MTRLDYKRNKDLLHLKGKYSWMYHVMVIVPFKLCSEFLNLLGRVFHLTYQQISVIFNLYLQGGILALTGLLPLIAQIYVTCRHVSVLNVFLLVLASSYGSIYVLGFMALLKHYPKPLERSFNRCVMDLRILSSKSHISYWALNLIIFVIWWIAIVGMNLLISYQVLISYI